MRRTSPTISPFVSSQVPLFIVFWVLSVGCTGGPVSEEGLAPASASLPDSGATAAPESSPAATARPLEVAAPCARPGSGAWAIIEAGGDGVRCDPETGLRLQGRVMGVSTGAGDGLHQLRPARDIAVAEDGRYRLQGRLGR